MSDANFNRDRFLAKYGGEKELHQLIDRKSIDGLLIAMDGHHTDKIPPNPHLNADHYKRMIDEIHGNGDLLIKDMARYRLKKLTTS
jgi:hypothetical protein